MTEADATAGAGRAPSRLTRALMIAARLSVIRTLYLSLRHRGWCIVARGTRLKISRRARIELTPGSRLYLGFGLTSFTGSRCFVRLGPGARLSVDGTVQLVQATRIYVAHDAHLEIGGGCYLNDSATVICTGHIRIGHRCAVSLNTTILDGNIHELVLGGAPRPRTQSVIVGDDVWIGLGATIMPGVKVGDQAVIGAGSVVTADVPSHTVVAGNPARVIARDAEWAL
ncbi:MAG TPA: acyltransferase [Streptosporangiaceae bacterium]|nr:acyltransferase [Streptosporangiaceae bacterium]